MATSRKSTDEKLDALRKRQEAIKSKLDALEAKKKADQRRQDTRRAFVVGAAALERADADPAFRDALRKALQASALRDTDKAVIADLLGLRPPATPQKTEAA